MSEVIFERKIYQKMLAWKEKSNGQTALRIEGARRVGKSTVVGHRVKNEYASHLIIDFANVSSRTRKIFEDGLGDGIDDFLMKLQVSEGVSLTPRDGAIVFDEVQKCTKAREMIKYLVKDGRFDYIETGSLITLITRQKNALIPSEERHLEMYPMDFEEFLWTRGDKISIPYLRDRFERREPLGDSFHSKFIQMFREYMVVGGMPRVVAAYGPSKDIEAAEEIKRDILDLYRNDLMNMEKLAGRNVKRVFEGIPSMLAMQNKLFSPGKIRKGSRTRDYLRAVEALNDARITNTCIDCTDPSPALKLALDDEVMKCYLADTGLLVTMAFASEDAIGSEIYKELILNRLSVNKGMFFENVVAQQLVAAGHELIFNRFEIDDKNYEIDFLISRKNKVNPIEVKSSQYRQHKSLDAFMERYGSILGESYIIHSKDLKQEAGVTFVPVYMTMFL
ncbi:MAG: AAA family ATPase [archaeon]|nr:AAA family ATPase [archaeon]